MKVCCNRHMAILYICVVVYELDDSERIVTFTTPACLPNEG